MNTNAEKSSSNGLIIPSLEFLASGGGVVLRKFSRNGSTPKFVRAEPKNTGERTPACTALKSNSSLAPSRSSTSSTIFL